MTVSFLIEFRLRGFAKQYADWVNARIQREARRIRIRELPERRFVPHISLFGKAKTDNLRRVVSEVEGTCQKYSLIRFKVGGFDNFQQSKCKLVIP